jgi:hypothetical protein
MTRSKPIMQGDVLAIEAERKASLLGQARIGLGEAAGSPNPRCLAALKLPNDGDPVSRKKRREPSLKSTPTSVKPVVAASTAARSASTRVDLTR